MVFLYLIVIWIPDIDSLHYDAPPFGLTTITLPCRTR